MWRKPEENNAQPSANPAPSSAPQASQGPSPVAAPSDSPARTSPNIKIKGELTSHEDFFWDGVFEGKIHIPDGKFTIGPNARISAGIDAREIVIQGEVVGTLKGERVHVSKTGRVTGDMETHGIVIEDGALLHSNVHVGQKESASSSASPAPARSKQAAAGASSSASTGANSSSSTPATPPKDD
ncbi:MAG TPA: polymer-forming cytoskeletal protein [Terriglobales bacterium]|nr:polymer-forming cytoskeletal protein [Terriglobales bacterium]